MIIPRGPPGIPVEVVGLINAEEMVGVEGRIPTPIEQECIARVGELSRTDSD
jgi:hypothetical protein